ncbi:MAG: efflux RND transporter permease subunit [Gemmatimonadota bacterium]|nr:MAG: efflux RND transporter permease subunit [Gemmatimonadota bacterium]
MLDKLIRTSIRNRWIVVLAALILFAYGAFVAIRAPLDVFPDLTAPTVTVLTEAHGMAPEEVERLVTFPLETAVNGASGVRRVRSTSVQGFSAVWVEFDWGTDIYKARQIVNEKLQMVQAVLPEGVDQPTLAPITSLVGEILTIGLTSETTSLMDLRTLADFDIRRRLLAVPGVAQVKVYGGEVKQYQVFINPDLLRKYDLSLHEVIGAAQGANLNAAGGFYVHSGQEYLIRGLGRIQELQELEQTVVTVRDNVPILLRDIARVQIGPATKIGEASINTQQGVLITLAKQPDVNTLELTEHLNEVIDNITVTLPDGVTLHRDLFRQADFIDRAVSNVVHALRDGALLVVLILLLFLSNIRSTIIAIVAIPLSLLFSILILRFFDLTINTMTLGGIAIAIGALVDDAIIDVENVFRRLRQNRQQPAEAQQPFLEVVFSASSEIRAPITIATFIVIVVFLPLFFLSGIEGRLLQPLGLAYVSAIFASLVVAMTVTPAMCSLLLRNVRHKKNREPWIVRQLQSVYRPVLEFAIRHKRFIILAAVMILVAAIGTFPFLGRSFLPEFNEGALNISIATIPGTALEESDRIGHMAEGVLLEIDEILSVSRRTGRTELDEHSLGSHAAEMEIVIDNDGISRDDLLGKVRRKLNLLPGTVATLSQPISHRIDHMLSGTRANIAIKIFGTDLKELRTIGNRIQQLIEPIPGVADLSMDLQMDIPQVRIRADRRKMAAYGVTMADIDDLIDTAFLGQVVSEVYEGQNQHDLVVRYDVPFRDDLSGVRNSLIDTPVGARIPLEMVADITIDHGPNYISRENVMRKLVVQCNVTGRGATDVVDDIRGTIERNIDLAQGYYIEYGGQFESEAQARRVISLLSILSLILICISLFLQYKNFRQVLLSLINLPLALIGGIIAVAVTSGQMSIASIVGFITLFGISVRNGIILVSHYNMLISQGQEVRDAVINGSLERLSPILMTALTTGLALTPLAFAGSRPGNEIQAPLAVVVLGGLLTSTVLNMIVLPVLFEKWGAKKQSDSNNFK